MRLWSGETNGLHRCSGRELPIAMQSGASSGKRMAEREGFEPSVPLRTQRFSRPSYSTTLAPLRRGMAGGLKDPLRVAGADHSGERSAMQASFAEAETPAPHSAVDTPARLTIVPRSRTRVLVPAGTRARF